MTWTFRLTRARGALAAALLASFALAGPATAQVVVQDPSLILGQFRQTFAEAKEFGLQAKRWSDTYKSYQDTYQHYQQQLIRLQRLGFGDPQMEDSFPERPRNYGIEDLCPARDGGDSAPSNGVLGRLYSAAAPSLDNRVVDEQRKICERMVQAENDKYNESVRMLRTLMQRNREFQALQRQRDQVGQNQGALAANDNETQRFLVRTSMDLDYWQARMTAYRSYIDSLQWDQARLARRAMRGKQQSVIGQVVQAAALKAALSH